MLANREELLCKRVSQQAGDSLQSGMLAGSVFPLVMIVSLILLGRNAAKKKGN